MIAITATQTISSINNSAAFAVNISEAIVLQDVHKAKLNFKV